MSALRPACVLSRGATLAVRSAFARTFALASTTRVTPPTCHIRQQRRCLYNNPDVPVSTPDQAIQILRAGNKRFLQGKTLSPNRNLERLLQTADVQKPFAAFLSCADSRVPIEILFDQGFGDVFVTRVAGNVVTTEITASLEYGCAVLGAKVMYVLGHKKCGAVAATVDGSAVPGVISCLYYHINQAVKRAKGCPERAVEENVRLQMERLYISPVLSKLVEEGELKIMGGVFDVETGVVEEVIQPCEDK